MRGNADLSVRPNRRGMACAAVRRSAGQCEAFCGEYAGDDEFLLYLSEQAPCLKSLRLISCYDVSFDGFAGIIRRFPLLEELELSQCPELMGCEEVYDVLPQALPQLKHLRINKQYFNGLRRGFNINNDAWGIGKIHELRSLQLLANNLNNDGLAVILKNCPHLESLDLRHCFNVDMDILDKNKEGKLIRDKCASIKTVRLPGDSTDDCDFDVGSPRFACSEVDYYSPVPPDPYWEEDDDDDYYYPSRYEADLDKYEKVLPRSMRTFI